jgi:type VI secretion system secreted protein Hcp
MIEERSSQLADIFLWLPGIDGESTDAGFPSTIELYSANWGWDLPETSPDRFGPAQAHQIVVSKAVDSASPQLVLMLSVAKRIITGRINFRKPGELGASTFIVIDLFDVVVRRISAESSGPVGLPSEQVSLGFSRGFWKFKRRNADGSYSDVRFVWPPPA